jgi:energy-coupling factor transport system ATP-binding protein
MLIELIDVSYTYMPGTTLSRLALEKINLAIAEGELVGIIGATGSGKSTLIQHFNGLLEPTEGVVLYKGRQIGSEISAAEVRKEVGILFQFPENQLFGSTVFEDVAFGVRNLITSELEIMERVREALRLVNLDFETFAERSPFSLSGGEMRKVAIAGVLVRKPSVLVLDEPTTGLDYWGRQEIISHIQQLHESGITVVWVTHDIDEIARLATRVVVLSEGQLILDDSPEKVFVKRDFLEQIGLATPQVTQVLQSLKNQGWPVKVDTFQIKTAAKIIAEVLK